MEKKKMERKWMKEKERVNISQGIKKYIITTLGIINI